MIVIERFRKKMNKIPISTTILPEHKELIEELGDGSIARGLENIAYTILKDREEQKKLKKEQKNKIGE